MSEIRGRRLAMLCSFAIALAATMMSASPGLAQEGRQAQVDTSKQQACPDCQARLDASGWCESCGQGVAKGMKTSCQGCLEAIWQDGWCEGCGVGYVDAEKTSCPGCHAARTSAEGAWCPDCAKGYAKGLETECRSCLGAIQADGWCDGCSVGFAAGQRTKCESCHEAMTSPAGAWCADCGVGYRGGVKTECKSCLTALQSDGWCDGCGVGYVNLVKTGCKGCHQAMAAPEGAWCADCGVGRRGTLKTACRSCFAAMRTDGSCEGCGTRFQDERSFKRVTLHVRELRADGGEKSVRDLLSAQPGIRDLKLDPRSGIARFELETTDGTVPGDIVAALASRGLNAEESDGD